MSDHPIGRYTEVVLPERRARFAQVFLITVAIGLTFVTGWATGVYTWSEWGRHAAAPPSRPAPPPPAPATSPFSLLPMPAQPDRVTEKPLKPEPGEYPEIAQLIRSRFRDAPVPAGNGIAPAAIEQLFNEHSYKFRLSTQPEFEVDPLTRHQVVTLQDGVAYYRPVRFDAGSRQRFIEQWSIWRSRPVGGLVIDLRYFRDGNNFEGAASLISLFSAPGRALFSLEGMDFPQQLFRSEFQPLERLSEFPIVLIVNRHTRGAAEALACILRRDHAALVIGEATAGEGGIYTETRLKSGRYLRMATARLTMSDGSVLLGVPLEPDLTIPVDSGQERSFFDAGQIHDLQTTIQLPVIPKRRADEEMNPDPQLDNAEVELPPVDDRLLMGAEIVRSIAIYRNNPREVAKRAKREHSS